MPAPGKRVKNKRVARYFIIGSEARPLPTNHPMREQGHTKAWIVYLRTHPKHPEISTYIHKVQFKLHPTYPNPQRMVENPPFELHETGYGSFNVEMRIFFVQEAGEKPVWRTHLLQIEEYGTEEEKQKQLNEGLVRSEIMEQIEFNEPYESFFDLLTSDAQFEDPAARGRGSGKGKKGNQAANSSSLSSKTCDLPERGTPNDPYSKQMEKQQVEKLASVQDEIAKLLQEQQALIKSREEEMADLKATGDWAEGTTARKR